MIEAREVESYGGPRWKFTKGLLKKHPDGDYVSYADFESQLAALAAKDAENAKQAAEIERLTQENNEMQQIINKYESRDNEWESQYRQKIGQQAAEIERIEFDCKAWKGMAESQTKEIEQLQARVAELQERLNQPKTTSITTAEIKINHPEDE